MKRYVWRSRELPQREDRGERRAGREGSGREERRRREGMVDEEREQETVKEEEEERRAMRRMRGISDILTEGKLAQA